MNAEVLYATRSPYGLEIMGNGLTSIICRASKSRGCFETATGQYRHGDLRLPVATVLELIRHRRALDVRLAS